MSSTKTLLIGLTAGAILGILFAPAKGSETRQNLSDAGKKIRDTFDDIKCGIQDAFGNSEDENEEGPALLLVEEIRELTEEERADAQARSAWRD